MHLRAYLSLLFGYGILCPMEASHKDTQQEEDLRRWVANRLKKNDVPQPIWAQVKEDGYVHSALNNPKDNHLREDLLNEVKRFIRFQRRMPSIDLQDSVVKSERRPLQRQDEASVSLLSTDIPMHTRHIAYMSRERQDEESVVPTPTHDPVRKRAEAFTLYLAKMAAEDDLVKQFRQRVLDGVTVSYEEAVALMDSAAAAVFSLEWFEENGVPFIGHKARVWEDEWIPEEFPHFPGTITVEWDGGESVFSFEGVTPVRSFQVLLLSEDGESAWFRNLRVLEDSVLGVFWKLAQQTWRFPAWGPQDIPSIPMFVLMGLARVVGVPYTTHNDSRLYQPITIKVPPWFSVENVSQVYKSLKRVFPTKPQPSPRRLALFEFVMLQPEVRVPAKGEIPKVPSWAALVRYWNESLPAGHEWHYKDRRNFRRDFLKAFDQIVNYYY
jgi:hypothetical protein